MRILKWTLEIIDRQTLMLPMGAHLLTVQAQGESDAARLWALCDETTETEPRVIAIYGTGNPISSKPGDYIATFQMYGGQLVWHVFELTARDLL